MLRVGIIGSGFGLYGLLPAFSSIETCQVVAYCGQKTARALTAAQNYQVKALYTEWQVMLENENLDAIALAVTPNAQYQIVKAALEKGLHVFAEKPLAATLGQAQEITALANEKSVTHSIDFIFPEIDAWKRVKQMLDDKDLGALEHISVNWDFLGYDIKNNITSWKTNPEAGGGALSFYFSHTLYYLEYFGGKIARVKSLLSYVPENLNRGEVGVDLLLRFENGTGGYAHICCNSRGMNRHQILFRCRSGAIMLETQNSVTQGFTITAYEANGVSEIIRVEEPPTISGEDERVRIVRKIAARFVDACIQRKSMIPSFDEGLRVQSLIEVIKSQSF